MERMTNVDETNNKIILVVIGFNSIFVVANKKEYELINHTYIRKNPVHSVYEFAHNTMINMKNPIIAILDIVSSSFI
jgi:hypothetical protein